MFTAAEVAPEIQFGLSWSLERVWKPNFTDSTSCLFISIDFCTKSSGPGATLATWPFRSWRGKTWKTWSIFVFWDVLLSSHQVSSEKVKDIGGLMIIYQTNYGNISIWFCSLLRVYHLWCRAPWPPGHVWAVAGITACSMVRSFTVCQFFKAPKPKTIAFQANNSHSCTKYTVSYIYIYLYSSFWRNHQGFPTFAVHHMLSWARIRTIRNLEY